MKSTKSYGVVSGWQEHQMLVHAEHTRQSKEKQRHTDHRKESKHEKDHSV